MRANRLTPSSISQTVEDIFQQRYAAKVDQCQCGREYCVDQRAPNNEINVEQPRTEDRHADGNSLLCPPRPQRAWPTRRATEPSSDPFKTACVSALRLKHPHFIGAAGLRRRVPFGHDL